ncbi:MAG TPA: suppressor of fused domain protein [Nostocaceae cyanobacterium]|nr:suppressor of fused domain protein [Nostocaceae cyanobacterium]
MNREAVITAIQHILESSPYFEFIFPHLSQLGIKIENEVILLNFDYFHLKINFSYFPITTNLHPQLWIHISEKALLDFAFQQIGIEHLVLENPGTSKPPIHPALERLVLKCFFNPSIVNSNITDREELIYAALFSFQPAQIIWQHSKFDIKVLKYAQAFNDLDVYVTSGLSNPEMGDCPIFTDEFKLIGWGYELILLSPPDTLILGEQLVGWTKYIINTGNHILREDWLEYEEKTIPQTKLSGFIITSPLSFPEQFPLLDGTCFWHLLLGVTQPELNMIKNSNGEYIEYFLKQLINVGYCDYTTIDRKSVINQSSKTQNWIF